MKPTSRLWTPPGRTGRELRNARVKVVGSILIFAMVVLAVAWRLL